MLRILGGDFPENSHAVVVTSIRGKLKGLAMTKGMLRFQKYRREDIASVEIVTNSPSTTVLGRSRSRMLVAIEFVDGKRALLAGKPKEVEPLLGAVFGKQVRDRQSSGPAVSAQPEVRAIGPIEPRGQGSRTMLGRFKSLATRFFWVFIAVNFAGVVALAHRHAGLIAATLFLVAGMVSLTRPEKYLPLGRVAGTVLVTFSLLSGTLLAVSFVTQWRDDARLTVLRSSDPQAYLAALASRRDTDLYLSELKVLDPSRYEAEHARIEQERRATAELERARAEQAERDRELEEGEHRRKEAEEWFARREAEDEQTCLDGTQAFVMSQEFVKQRLKAPSTADFPRVTTQGVTVTYLGGCRHRVDAYVDAQNGFGALIRSSYTATLKHVGQRQWQLESVEIN